MYLVLQKRGDKKVAPTPNSIRCLTAMDFNEPRDAVHKGRSNFSRKETLLDLIDLKDPKLTKHCKAVAGYAEKIGMRLGIEKKRIPVLREAGLFHDVGKIMIDSSILNKKEAFTVRETATVQGHSEKGMRILSFFQMKEVIVDVAWHHHERWDGEGYPDGLSGEEIGYFTRIISVADCIDAMADNRPYRRHLADKEIIEQLKLAKGSQLDPQITDVAIKLIEEGNLINN